MRAVVLALLIGCAPTSSVAPARADLPEVHHDATRFYAIWLGGARVGTATEKETWSPRGVTLRRTELMDFLRGDAEVVMQTTIEVEADAGLVAHKVTWTEATGGALHSAEAMHDRDGWHGPVVLDATATPAELVPLLVRRDGKFDGAVFMPARNFVAGRGHIDPVAPNRLVARIALDAGPLAEATIDQGADAMPARVVDGEGVIATRISERESHVPFVATDLVAAAAVPITGHHGTHLFLSGQLLLPALPGQAAVPARSGVEVQLGAQLPGALPSSEIGPDRAAEIRSLVANVRARITPDLGAAGSTHDVDAATAGDCTTFALAYTAIATRKGIPTRVVTGLRVDGDRLVRHRWAVSWTGRSWIAVDAAYGAAPAGGNLIGLAIHDADDAGLVAGEAALTQVRTASWR
ncbi:MAG: transglutaminase domain-containing protein [Kofleriaceae bacterium]